jgi:hypothetical protein
MNFTVSAFTGGRAVTFTATSDGVSTVVRSGSQATLEAVVVHMGMQGEPGDIVGDPLAYYILAKN